MGFDLSKVMFIATSNNMSTIQPPMRDRMEVINMTGYTIEEKVEIARKHLLPKQIEEHGISARDINLGKKQIEKIVAGYTRESGVRGLEKQIARVVQSVAKSYCHGGEYNVKVTEKML
jgi:ATP-dependent Lon protease